MEVRYPVDTTQWQPKGSIGSTAAGGGGAGGGCGGCGAEALGALLALDGVDPLGAARAGAAPPFRPRKSSANINPLDHDATPIPTRFNRGLIMFARCTELDIKALCTASALGAVPTFSPHASHAPAFPGKLGLWKTRPSAAILLAWEEAIDESDESRDTGPSPALALELLMRLSNRDPSEATAGVGVGAATKKSVDAANTTAIRRKGLCNFPAYFQTNYPDANYW